MLLPVFAFAAIFRLLAGPATFSPVPAVAVVSGHLDHALSVIRCSYIIVVTTAEIELRRH